VRDRARRRSRGEVVVGSTRFSCSGVTILITSISVAACSSCGRGANDGADGSANSRSITSSQSTISSWPAASNASDAAGAPKPGMVWIPSGTLKAGTPADHTPRVADEEMAGVPVEMGGFYIDLLPWPNEPNAIPTSNVSRDDAEQLCTSKGKRLCTELEWERACKGPDSTIYEYGDAYRKEACGTGIALETAARRPTGEHAQCKTAFGVAEMHGSVWEWTSSPWGRGARETAQAQGVLRGGNSVAGELVGRCANAIARSPSKKAATMGFRCCAGMKNAAEVKLELQGTPGVAMRNEALATAFIPAIATAVANGSPSIEPKSLRAWSWIPVANEELVLAMGCTTAPRACGLVVGRNASSPAAAGSSSDGGAGAGASNVLASVSTGRELPEITRNGDARHIRVRSLDLRGIFSREVTYVYGRVDVGDMKRP
jgi:sulfatase modifying factor 1